jgi:DNA-binding transcriptional LysR family regulator
MEQDMKYILQIYKDRSFSKAAEHLYMTQPALSIAVKRVEDSLGAELFDRRHHPLELTQAGEAYLEAVHRIHLVEEDLARQIGDLRDLNAGSLRIGGTHFINTYLLAALLGRYMKQYPGIQVEVAETDSVRLGELLQRKELDLTLSCDPKLVERFERRPAFLDRVLLAVPNSYSLPPEAEAAALSGEEVMAGRHNQPDCPRAALGWFRDLDFILLSRGNNLRARAEEMFRQADFTPRVRMELAQLVTAYRFADNGIGCTFISDLLVRRPPRGLRLFKLDLPQTRRQFYVLFPKRDYAPFALRAFLNFADNQVWGLRPDQIPLPHTSK